MKSFNQFFIAVTSDYKMTDPDSEDYLTAGWELWEDMFNGTKENYVTGPMYRACNDFAQDLMDHVLVNGQRELFYDYLTGLLPRVDHYPNKGFH